MSEIKVFKVGDCDWYAAANKKEAREEHYQIVGDDEAIELEEIEELSPKAMFHFEHRGDGDEVGFPMTFRAYLDKCIADGDKFPCHFATSEY